MKKKLFSTFLAFSLLLSGVTVAAADTTHDSQTYQTYDLPHQH